jgi:hypothetical protein
MSDEQIRAEAIKATIQCLALFPQDFREKVLNKGGNDPHKNIIAASHIFEDFIRTGAVK